MALARVSGAALSPLSRDGFAGGDIALALSRVLALASGVAVSRDGVSGSERALALLRIDVEATGNS